MTEAPRFLLACLCAQWCGTCSSYRNTFEGLAAELGADVSCHWVDIEDHADALGNLDIENFPTLLIAERSESAWCTLFFGVVTPHAGTLKALFEKAHTGNLQALADASPDLPAAIGALADTRVGR